jgi:hypothetical protein
MKVPGCTAEASLERTIGHYHVLGTGAISTAQVVPALPPCEACELRW